MDISSGDGSGDSDEDAHSGGSGHNPDEAPSQTAAMVDTGPIDGRENSRCTSSNYIAWYALGHTKISTTMWTR